MTRVGFAPALDAGWLGGLNYYRNLFAALAQVNDPDFDFTLFAGRATDLRWVPREVPLQVVRSALLDPGTLANLVRRAGYRLARRDLLLGALVRAVQVLSHSGPLPGAVQPRTLGWIADLQHLHFPALFSDAERIDRDRVVARHLRYCSVVLVSSEAARNDLMRFSEAARARIAVLRFVATPPDAGQQPDAVALRAKYSLPERYFYLPNQFWVHKNHRLIVDALRVEVDACIVCTGDVRDYRRPDHYAELAAAARGVEDRFRVLGLVPQADAAALMRDAVAIINPSLFEGWATTVEEAKSLGKRVLLSDIPVHREQAPSRGRYFDPHDPQDAASAMREALSAFDPVEEVREAQVAASVLPARRDRFGRAYLDAVRQALTG